MSWYILKIVFIRGLQDIILEMVVYSSLQKKYKRNFFVTIYVKKVNDTFC